MTTSIKLTLVLLICVLTTACSTNSNTDTTNKSNWTVSNGTISAFNNPDSTVGYIGIESEITLSCDNELTLSMTAKADDDLVYYTAASVVATETYASTVGTADQSITDRLLPIWLSGSSAYVLFNEQSTPRTYTYSTIGMQHALNIACN